MNKKVPVFGLLRFPAESMEPVRPHLKTFVNATRNLDGSIAYDVAEDLFDPGLIRFSELWPSHELLDARLKALHIIPWREAAKQHGLQERVFTAYGINGSRPV